MADEIINTLPPVAEPEPPVETSPVETPEQPDHNVAPDPSKLKDEIEELRKQRQKAEEDALYWRKQKAEARGEFFREKKEPPPPPPGAGVEPQPGDFDDYNKYVVALTDHRVRLAKAEWDRDANRRTQEQTQQQRQERLHEKLQEGFQKYPDFEEVAFDRTATHITPMVVDILAECEAPADVAYYLAKNRIEGVAIARMTPIQAARAIAKIEAKITQEPPPLPKKTISGAPPPISPIGGSRGSFSGKDPEKMSNKEFAAWRESQGARKF